jgi:hypothetical protein
VPPQSYRLHERRTLIRLTAELFFVNFDWQLVLEPGTYSDDLPQKLYLFVENIPIDRRGYISQPTTFWSVHPDRMDASLPAGFRWEEWLSARGSGRSWEEHHYDAARVLQEQNEFDPATGGATDSLGFSRYKGSVLPIPEK